MSARTKTTKPAAKKAATKRAAKKAAKPERTYTPLEDPDNLPLLTFQRKFDADEAADVHMQMVSNIRKSVDTLSDKSKTRPIHMFTPASLSKMLFPYNELYFQNAISSIGFRVPSFIEFIAPEHIGKTTMCFDMIGRLLEAGCYAAYIECEGKMMKTSHIKRLLHRDKKRAAVLMNAVAFYKARTLIEFDSVMIAAMRDLRKRCDSDPRTKGHPIFIFGDPWSGLMSSADAAGIYSWGETGEKSAAFKDAGSGSNMLHSKHAHILKKRLPSLMEEYNACVVFFNHQNAKVDMGGVKSFMQPSELDNDTTIGGRAMKQLASYRFVMCSMGDIRSTDRSVIGVNVQLKVKKNAYGPRARKCSFALFFDRYADTSDSYDRVVSFAETTAAWMAAEKLLGTTVTAKRYTCDALGCVAVTARQLYDALYSNPEQLAALGASLGIEGYAAPELHADVASHEVEADEDAEDDSDVGPGGAADGDADFEFGDD